MAEDAAPAPEPSKRDSVTKPVALSIASAAMIAGGVTGDVALGASVDVLGTDRQAPKGQVDLVIKCTHLNISLDMEEKDREEALALRKLRHNAFAAIKFSGLDVVRKQGSEKDEEGRSKFYYVMVSAREDVLEKEAERIGLNKRLKPEYHMFEKDFVLYDTFTQAFKDKFVPGPRQYFTSLERQRCILSKMEAHLSNNGAGLDLDSLRNDEVFTDFTFMPQEDEEAALMDSWVGKYLSNAPVHEVRHYLGGKVGFYFAFMDHYVKFNIPLAIISAAVMAYQGYESVLERDWEVDNIFVPFYCILIGLWSTIMLEAWKRQQSVLAFQWDVEKFQEDEPARPEYLSHQLTRPVKGVFEQGVGFVKVDLDAIGSALTDADKIKRGSLLHMPGTSTSKMRDKLVRDEEELEEGAELVFPASVHKTRVVLSLALTVSFIICVATGALATLAYKVVLRNSIDTYGTYIGSAVNVAFISLTDQLWSRAALYLNDWEMYRTDSEWYDALIYKTFLFRFINKNATPFYIAFVQGVNLRLFGIGEADSCPNDNCIRALAEYLLVAVVFSEFSRNFLTLIPLFVDEFKKRYRAKKMADSGKTMQQLLADGTSDLTSKEAKRNARLVERVETEFLKTEYPGTFDEMLEIAIQFGYMTMFAVGFPPAPVFVLVNNLIERKTDALKTLKMRRPRYIGAMGIGSWLYVFEFLAVVSVMTNMLIMFFSSRVLREQLSTTFDLTQILLLTVVIEHLLLLLKFGIAIVVADVPTWVKKARVRAALREKNETEASIRQKNRDIKKRLAAQDDDDNSDAEDDDPPSTPASSRRPADLSA